MAKTQIRIDPAALAAWKQATGIELDDGAAANAAVRLAADVEARERWAEAYGMKRVIDWVARGLADPQALAAGDAEVTVTGDLEIHARIGDARFVLGHNSVNARRRVERAAKGETDGEH